MSTQSTNALAVLEKETETLKAIVEMTHGGNQDVAPIVANEITILQGMAVTKPEITQCEPASVLMAIKNVLKNNLSFDPQAGLVYTKTRNIPLEKDGNGKVTQWGKALEIQFTCEGKLSVAYQCGVILDHDRPSVTKNAEGKVTSVTFRYLKASYGGPRWVENTFDLDDFSRWQAASHKENSRNKDDRSTKSYANALYTSVNGGIDPEFARAKAINHSMKKLGINQNAKINPALKPASNTIDPSVAIQEYAFEDVSEDADAVVVETQSNPPAETVPNEDAGPKDDLVANINL